MQAQLAEQARQQQLQAQQAQAAAQREAQIQAVMNQTAVHNPGWTPEWLREMALAEIENRYPRKENLPRNVSAVRSGWYSGQSQYPPRNHNYSNGRSGAHWR